MIRLLSLVGMAASGGVLAWYQSLGQTDREQADASAVDAAKQIFTLAAEKASGHTLDHASHRLFN